LILWISGKPDSPVFRFSYEVQGVEGVPAAVAVNDDAGDVTIGQQILSDQRVLITLKSTHLQI